MKNKSESLDFLFEPRSIAVVGVSPDPSKLGSVVTRNLIDGGYRGKIFPIARQRFSVDGRLTFGSISEVGEPVDVAFLAVPATAALDALEDAANAGVKVAIIGAAGFAESGAQAEQQRLEEIVARTGIRVVGPNCNGIYNPHFRLSLGFNRAHGRRLAAGRIAILSHSGALFEPLVRLLDRAGAGLSCFVSAGNGVDLDILDYAEHFQDDPNTQVIAILCDAIADGRRLASVVRNARKNGKSVIVLKLGASELGAAAAVAHSSRLTGVAEAYDAYLNALGVPCLHTPEGFIAAAALLDRFGPRDGGLAVMTTSGAGGALIADLGERAGIAFPVYEDATTSTLDRLKMFSTVGNPTDLGIFGLKNNSAIARAIVDDTRIGACLAYVHCLGGETEAQLIAALGEAQHASGKPIIVVCPGGLNAAEAATYAGHGLTTLPDTASAMEALSALLTRPGDLLLEQPGTPPPLPDADGALSEYDSLNLLSTWSISTVERRLTRSPDEAAQAARDFGWPVVLKAMPDGVSHKSDHGFVALNIADEDAVREVIGRFPSSAPVLVQPMVRGGLEAIVGLSRVPALGLMVMVGLGGVHAETIKDVAMCPVAASMDQLIETLDGTALGRVLLGPRWKYPAARPALIELLRGLRGFGLAYEDRLEAVDLNPVVLGERGATAVDALVVLRRR